MKKIFIDAYLNENIGDDLFIDIILKRYPNVQFYIYAPQKYKEIFKNHENLIVINNESITNSIVDRITHKFLGVSIWKKKLKKYCDATIYVGGSLFMQDEHWEKRYIIDKKRKEKNKPFFLIGTNFGPSEDLNYISKYEKLFSTLDDVCFRDSYSYEKFRKLNNVRMAADIVFQYEIGERYPIVNNRITVSVINLSFRPQLKDYKENYIKSIKSFIDSKIDEGFEVDLVSFCKSEGDEDTIIEILSDFSDQKLKSINVINYRGNLDEILAVFSKSNLIIATRFHAMILGWVSGTPTIPIIYNKKMLNVINDIKEDIIYFKVEDLKEDSIKSIDINNIERLDVSLQSKDAANHFQKVDNYLL